MNPNVTANRRRLAQERSRERQFHQAIQEGEKSQRASSSPAGFHSQALREMGGGAAGGFSPPTAGYSSTTSSAGNRPASFGVRPSSNNNSNHSQSRQPSADYNQYQHQQQQQQQQLQHQQQLYNAALQSGSSTTSPPKSDSHDRSPLEYRGDHVSYLPPHVIESLKPYYSRTGETMTNPNQPSSALGPRDLESGERPRPPSFVFAPKHLDSANVNKDYLAMGVAPPVDPQQQRHHGAAAAAAAGGGSFLPSALFPPSSSSSSSSAGNQQQQQGGAERENLGNVASSTQTMYDANAPVSYVDISASNAVLQRRVARLEEQLEESIQQREKLGEVIKSMSYAIVPPLAFLPSEFYEKHKQVVDVCCDYAILYRSALRATPSVGDIHQLDQTVQEQSKEHLMDRVVMLTSEVMHLRKRVVDYQKADEMSPC